MTIEEKLQRADSREEHAKCELCLGKRFIDQLDADFEPTGKKVKCPDCNYEDNK